MPQFDFMSFPVQIFWITVLIYTMHLVYLHFYLPHAGAILKFRDKIALKTNVSSSEIANKVWDKSFLFIKRK